MRTASIRILGGSLRAHAIGECNKPNAGLRGDYTNIYEFGVIKVDEFG